MNDIKNICSKCDIKNQLISVEDTLKVKVVGNKCRICKDLLLIDDKNKYFIKKIPSIIQKTKKRSRNKYNIFNDSTSLSFAIFNKNTNIKEDCINYQIKDIINEIINKALNNDNKFEVTEIGISIEFTPEFKENITDEIIYNLKNSLREMIIKQSNLKLNQNADLYLHFLFSNKNSLIDETNQNNFAFLMSISFKWKNIFIMGRYTKLSRRISQSKWNFSEKNVIVDTSIEELISNSLKELVKFEKITFSSSGREDIDVRMLGIEFNNNKKNQSNYGRPFAIEINNILENHYLFYSNIKLLTINNENIYSKDDFLKKLSDKIKELSKFRVFVFDLTFSTLSLVQKMNREVNEKKKSYVCICYSPISISNDEYLLLSKSINLPIIINQRTPIRVLHRRANIDRKREIFNINITPINQNYFILYLTTQAGTYIKEFINGDFGRTRPNLGDLIQKYLLKEDSQYKFNITIVQLDVLSIH